MSISSSSSSANRLGSNITLASFLAILSYVPFELVAKGSLIVCAFLFIVDPIPPLSRLISLVSLLIVFGLTKLYRQYQQQQQEEEAELLQQAEVTTTTTTTNENTTTTTSSDTKKDQ